MRTGLAGVPCDRSTVGGRPRGGALAAEKPVAQSLHSHCPGAPAARCWACALSVGLASVPPGGTQTAGERTPQEVAVIPVLRDRKGRRTETREDAKACAKARSGEQHGTLEGGR